MEVIIIYHKIALLIYQTNHEWRWLPDKSATNQCLRILINAHLASPDESPIFEDYVLKKV